MLFLLSEDFDGQPSNLPFHEKTADSYIYKLCRSPLFQLYYPGNVVYTWEQVGNTSCK